MDLTMYVNPQPLERLQQMSRAHDHCRVSILRIIGEILRLKVLYVTIN
jgi:hypothetical protein